MGIMDYLGGPKGQNAMGALGEILMATDAGRKPHLQPFYAQRGQIDQREKLRGLGDMLMGGNLGLSPQQQGILGKVMDVAPEQGMGIMLGQAFPSPGDPYARYKNVGGALWDVGAQGGPQQLSKPEVGGSRYYTVSTSQGYMLVDKHTGESRPLGAAPAGAPAVQSAPQTYRAPAADPTLQGEITAAKEGAKVDIENAATAPADIQSAEGTLKILQDFGNHPGFDSLYGGMGPFNLVPKDQIMNRPGGDAAAANAYLKQIEGKSFIQAFQDLKGGGHITEIEGQKATNAMSRLLDTRQSPKAARQALAELQEIINSGLQRAKQRGEQPTSQAPAQTAPQQMQRPPIDQLSDEELEALLRRLSQ